MSEQQPSWNEDLGAALVGAVVLVGITWERADSIAEEQLFGTVETADADGVILVLGGTREGERYHLPPDPCAFFPAEPGSYRLHSTGETVENPDFLATWTVTAR